MKQKQTILQKFIRFLLLLLLILAAGAAGFGTVAAIKYHQCAGSPEKAVIEQTAALSESRDVPIGRNIELSAEIRAPWGRTLTAFDVQPGKGSQLAGTPSWERVRIRWGSVVWKLRATLHAYHPGEIPAGTADVLIEGGAEKTQTLTLTLPAFTAKTLPVKDSDLPEIAGRITPPETPENRMAWIIAGIAVLLLLGIAIRFFLKHRNSSRHTLPPWTLALQSIGGIKDDLHNGRANAASAITRLTEKELIFISGRADLPGRPIQFSTTKNFLDYAGVNSLEELPASDVLSPNQISEWIRRASSPSDIAEKDVGLPSNDAEHNSRSVSTQAQASADSVENESDAAAEASATESETPQKEGATHFPYDGAESAGSEEEFEVSDGDK